MLLFLFACVMPMLDTPDDAILDAGESQVYTVGKLDRSIRSSLKLIIKDGDARGHATGNYFKYGKHRFIITAAHVVNAGEIWAEDGISILKTEVLWVDNDRDIAIIRPMGKLNTVKAAKFKINYDDNKVGSIIRYAGYPDSLGRMVLGGMVSKQTEVNIVLQSFALPGSSGSVIFDEKGRAMAVLSAVSVQANPWIGIPEIEVMESHQQ
jgi:S1-C subfamily serine protease